MSKRQMDKRVQGEARQVRRWLDQECERRRVQGKGPTDEWRAAEERYGELTASLPWWRRGW